jgi:TolA-binding protein
VENDFESAKKAFTQGRLKLSETYLLNILGTQAPTPFITDARYYLIKIYDKNNDFIKFISHVNQFLTEHSYDARCKEIFNLLLRNLLEKEAFNIALDYIRNYDFLVNDYSYLERIGHGLLKQNRNMVADFIFSLCPQTDTIKILRASVSSNILKKKEIYESIDGLRGKIYLLEYFLATGDTVSAHEIYGEINDSEVSEDILYRFTKISLVLGKSKSKRLASRLKKMNGFQKKANLIEALSTGYLEEIIVPEDKEECALLIEYLSLDTISRNPVDNLDIKPLLVDSLAEEKVEAIRKKVTRHYYLDSIYCNILQGKGRIEKAFKVIMPYMAYNNTRDYARKIRALKSAKEGEYHSVANDIVLLENAGSEMMLLLANSLTKLGKNSAHLYEAIVKSKHDSLLVHRAIKELIKIKYKKGEYHDIIKYKRKISEEDTNLLKIYIYSLAHTGERQVADSLFHQLFARQDWDLVNHYGEYLIDNRMYRDAAHYYDSVMQTVNDTIPEQLYYNYSLVSFLRGEIDTAYDRFASYIDDFGEEEHYHDALFKIGTINYLKHNFDSAAHYYGLASNASTLRFDALQNQLICYKKAENWSEAIGVGEKLILLVEEINESEIRFEIGYACLRAGKVSKAVENLKIAAQSESNPEYHYWLGEVYFAKGDFTRALYQYQRIVDLFPKDKMWMPTAQYKVGVVFEFMNEFDEAKRMYKKIIKKRGLKDTWGVEAQKRLEALEK